LVLSLPFITEDAILLIKPQKARRSGVFRHTFTQSSNYKEVSKAKVSWD